MIHETIHVDPYNLNLAADIQFANRVFDHTEQNHPDYLADLLRTGGLAETIRIRINRNRWPASSLLVALPYRDG